MNSADTAMSSSSDSIAWKLFGELYVRHGSGVVEPELVDLSAAKTRLNELCLQQVKALEDVQHIGGLFVLAAVEQRVSSLRTSS